MSDSDSDDSLLRQGAFSSARVNRHANDAAADDDIFLRKALEESKATFAAEEERRKSLTPRGAMNDDDEEEEGLEVLAPSSTVKSEKKHSPQSPTLRPRLSSSGVLADDPVDLASSGEEDSDVPLAQRLAKRRGAKYPAKHPANRKHKPRNLHDDSIELSSDEDIAQLKPPPVASLPNYQTSLSAKSSSKSVASKSSLAAAKRGPWESSRNEFGDDDSDDSFASLKATKSSRAVAERPPLSNNQDSDDSDDSFAALKVTVALKRNRTRTNRANEMSSDDSSDDDKRDSKPRATTKKQKKTAAPSDLSSDDSSSDDDQRVSKPRAKQKKQNKITATTKQRAAQERKQQKERERQEKKEQKERERQEKLAAKEREKLERQRQRAAKQAAAQAEKESKKRRREHAAQVSGKHAKEEIAVLMERNLFRHEVLTVVDDLQEVGYTVLEYPSGLGCNALQFIRKDFSHGGAQDAIQMLYAGNADGYVHLPVMAVVFDVPHDFLRLLERADHEEDDDYPELESWLRGVEAGWRAAWRVADNQRPRIILFLHQIFDALDKLWVKYKRQAQRDAQAPPTTGELHDAITWMLIEFQVECIPCTSREDISNHIKKMTRLLAEEPYQRQVTDLECVKKIKAACEDEDPPEVRSTDCWKRQLQQVPGVSVTTASSLVQYYPTARSLWIAYQSENLTENEKRLLLSECCGNGRRNNKLSETVYRVMTSQDANTMI